MALSIKVGDQKLLQARVVDGAGNIASPAALIWSSTDNTVATVTESSPGTPGTALDMQKRAVLHAIGAGTCTISCTDGSITGTLSVTVVSGVPTVITIVS